MTEFSALLATLNSVLWHEYVLYAIVATGITFTIWSGFSQYRALTHGPGVVRGRYDNPNDPGAINHFQALSAALSATVGLGNIGGVALAIALGGPGAVFWMWIIGMLGMAIKMTEVTLSMLYRNTDDPDNPHGGPMWVAAKAFEEKGLGGLGRVIGVIFCLTLLVAVTTAGNMFQAWNVSDLTEEYFSVPTWITGVVLALIVGSVIIGGIKRIGLVAGTLVPLMVVLYLSAGLYVLAVNISEIPGIFVLIFKSAFSSTEAAGAFVGGTAASAFLFGLKRAAFSNEAGQGSSPIAHSAAKTNEPVREGIVAGLEPFIDTIVVCTFTALIILSTGIWNRGPDITLDTMPDAAQIESSWQFSQSALPGEDWVVDDRLILIVKAHPNAATGHSHHRLEGIVNAQNGGYVVDWKRFDGPSKPDAVGDGIYRSYVGATLTAKAFDSVAPGLGKWLVSIAAWLFAISTMISWSYYGEQGMVFLAGERSVLGYKLVFCLLIVVSTLGILKTDADLDNLSGIGTAVMLFANIPICLYFGNKAMAAYRDYIGRLKSGQIKPYDASSGTPR